VLKLPCKHVFHSNCVMPWLEQKQNCPICRCELENTLPSLEEIDGLTIEEIGERLSEMNVEVVDLTSKEKCDMVALLYKHYSEVHAKEISETTISENELRPHPILNLTFHAFSPMLRSSQDFHSSTNADRIEEETQPDL